MNIFLGVIEDINDPLKQNRVRVRVFGVHSELKIKSNEEGIATEELPWSIVMMSSTSASTSGIGENHQLLQGSWVVGVSLNDAYSKLLIFGSIASMPVEFAKQDYGFNDPDGIYPTIINEPDINRLARNENIFETIIQTKNDNRVIGIESADGSSWDEPEYKGMSEYPHNAVKATKSGHVKEYDNTEGNERIHEYHKSGTFYEVLADGSKVVKVVGDDFEVIVGNNFTFISGNMSITIAGNSNINIKGDANVKVDGDLTHTVDGDIKLTASGNIALKGTKIDLN